MNINKYGTITVLHSQLVAGNYQIFITKELPDVLKILTNNIYIFFLLRTPQS